jgi:hypothetical protein
MYIFIYAYTDIYMQIYIYIYMYICIYIYKPSKASLNFEVENILFFIIDTYI